MYGIADERVLVLFCTVFLSWLLGCRGFASCSFYYWRTSWPSALSSCLAERKELLCYKSRKDIDDITEAFKLSVLPDAELEIWISSRNCSEPEPERCLSLHIEKSSAVWHYFQVGCNQRYPFICCTPETETTQELTSSTLPDRTTSSSAKSASSSSLSTKASTYFTLTTRKLMCENTSRRGIFWPDTEAGQEVVRSCPGNSIGNATWLCSGSNGQWSPNGPDMSQCRSLNFLDFKEKLNSSSASEAIGSLERAFWDREQEVFGEDLVDVISLMTSLPDRLSDELASLPSATRWTMTKESVHKTTSVFDYMIKLDDTWKDIKEDRRLDVGSHLLAAAENFALLLADAMVTMEDSIVCENMGLQVVKSEFGQSIQLPQWPSANSYNEKGSISLDRGYDCESDLSAGNISVVFMLYRDMRNILSKQQNNDSSKLQGTLNSAIVSTTLSQRRRPLKIKGKVLIVVENLKQRPNETACVFWNLDRNEWDASGCQLDSSNVTHTSCICNHLTNFAILMDYKGALKDVNKIPFFFITVIGCSISIVSLAICVFVFTCFSIQNRHAWGLRYSIHRNLCLTLLIANVVLVVGLDKTQNRTGCAVVAGLLHYFFLSAFSWMLLEGVHIYLLLVIVFASRRSHWEKYYLFGYGFPLIIVIITAICRPYYYGNDDTCWLSIEKGTIWAFNGPVACILMVNSAALFLAQWKASKMSTKDDNALLIKRWLRVTLILFPILGITWLFGFLYVGKQFEVAAYLFALLNSLQGFCIFVFHCLMDQKARSMFIASIRKKRRSIHTGSSGTQRRPKEDKDKKKGSDSSQTPIQITDSNQNSSFVNRTFSGPIRKAFKRDWTSWHKPWSFCFDVTVSDSKMSKFSDEHEELPKAVVLQWNAIHEK